MPTELDRFIHAQKRDYAQAKREITRGQKTSHWIWYIFPQLKELGYSDTAKHYGIVDFNEACEYLRNPELFTHYNEMATLVKQKLSETPALQLEQLMGGQTDAKKLVSSLTLFRGVAAFLEAHPGNSQHDFKALKDSCDTIYTIIEKQNYKLCPTSLAYLPSSNLRPQKKQLPINPNTLFSTRPSTPDTATVHPIKKTEPTIPKPITTEEPQPPAPVKTELEKTNLIRSQASSPIIPYLKDYIQMRPNEWSYHYNFLGIVALTYFVLDAILGTDYFHIKNSETKIGAATKLMHLLDPQYTGPIEPFTSAEQAALEEGRLGSKVAENGGLQHLIKTAPEHPLEEPSSETKLKS